MKINSKNTNLNLRHLRALHAIRSEGSFARAASLLGTVPSVLTETIRQLEESAGIALFDRRTRPPQLTPAGLEFVEDTRPVVEALDLALERFEDSADLRRGRLRLGASPSTIADYVAPALREFRANFPGISITIYDAPAEDLADLVNEGKIDLAIAGYSGDSPLLQLTELERDPVGLAVGIDHPLARLGRPILMADIDPESLIHLHEGAGTARLISQHDEIPLPLKSGAIRVQSTFGQLCLIRAGVGIGLLPRKAVLLFDDPELAFLPVADLSLERRISMITSSQRAISHVATKFIALCLASKQNLGSR